MYEYDVALSFAGENREYVREIAKKLKAKKLKVFYDEFEETNLWGKDLYQYLHYIYKECSLFCVVFVSSSYIKKAWTRHELKAAQNRAFLDNSEYILPLLLESGINLPGLPDTIGYISIKDHTIAQIVKMIYEKVYTVKPTKEEEFEIKRKVYTTVFQTFNFIIDKYICFGSGSKSAEIAFLQYLISDYKNFLLERAHEINSELYVFLVQILRELEKYIENGEVIDLYRSANLQYKTNALNTLKKAFEDSGFSEQFDFHFYLYSNDILNDRDGMLVNAIKSIVQKLSVQSQKPVSIIDYLDQITRLENFDEYVENGDNTELIEMLLNTEELKEMKKMFDDSPVITFDEGDPGE